MSSNLKVNTILPSTGTAIGIGTASGNIDVLGHIVGHNTPNISGINSVTATTFYGDGQNITGTTIRSNLTYDGSTLQNLQSGAGANLTLKATSNSFNALILDSNRSADTQFAIIDGRWNGNVVNRIQFVTGSDGTNKDDGYMAFHTRTSGASLAERLRITSDGKIGINDSSPDSIFSVKDTYVFSCAGGNSTTGMQIGGYDAGANSYNPITIRASQTIFNISGTERLRIKSGGTVAIPSQGASNANPRLIFESSADSNDFTFSQYEDGNGVYTLIGQNLQLTSNGNTNVLDSGHKTAGILFDGRNNGAMMFYTGGTNSYTEKLRIKSDGKIWIGATASQYDVRLHLLNGSAISGKSIDPLTTVLFEDSECRLQLQSDNTGSNASSLILSNDSKHWVVQQRATNRSNNFQIGYVDGTLSDANNQSSYAMQILTNSVAQFSTTGSFDTYTTAQNAYQFRHNFTNVVGVWISNTNTSHTKELLRLDSTRSGSSSFDLATFTTGNLGDDQFRFRGDGNGYCDGSFSGGGADYAEYFEWTDGNSSDEDRRGMTVVLDGNKVKLSTSSDSADDIIGVVSASPVVVGDGAYMAWNGKYLRDEYGAYDLDENGERKLNPSYDDTKTYVTREDRKEWDTIGMVGKLRIRKGQKTGTRWIKMRDTSAFTEEWLVR